MNNEVKHLDKIAPGYAKFYSVVLSHISYFDYFYDPGYLILFDITARLANNNTLEIILN